MHLPFFSQSMLSMHIAIIRGEDDQCIVKNALLFHQIHDATACGINFCDHSECVLHVMLVEFRSAIALQETATSEISTVKKVGHVLPVLFGVRFRKRHGCILIEVHTAVHGAILLLRPVFSVCGKERNSQKEGLIFGTLVQKLNAILFIPLGNMLFNSVSCNVM